MNQNEFIDVIKCKRTYNEFMSIFHVISISLKKSFNGYNIKKKIDEYRK